MLKWNYWRNFRTRSVYSLNFEISYAIILFVNCFFFEKYQIGFSTPVWKICANLFRWETKTKNWRERLIKKHYWNTKKRKLLFCLLMQKSVKESCDCVNIRSVSKKYSYLLSCCEWLFWYYRRVHVISFLATARFPGLVRSRVSLDRSGPCICIYEKMQTVN